MHITISHEAFGGDQETFQRLREEVARAAGGSIADGIVVLGEGFTAETHPGLWAFLTHSDHGGEMTHGVCAQVATDLDALLPAVRMLGSESTGEIYRDGGYVACVSRFAGACRAVAGEAQEAIVVAAAAGIEPDLPTLTFIAA